MKSQFLLFTPPTWARIWNSWTTSKILRGFSSPCLALVLWLAQIFGRKRGEGSTSMRFRSLNHILVIHKPLPLKTGETWSYKMKPGFTSVLLFLGGFTCSYACDTKVTAASAVFRAGDGRWPQSSAARRASFSCSGDWWKQLPPRSQHLGSSSSRIPARCWPDHLS